ncbi:NB-ARC domain-containing protein [Modestobacter altitudinis]|uniref:NB-ARC domain-containing protein n=1 Tax=Modestobacter altitudinis TaxID=2213158 RepID=UPI00110CE3C2|nr:NB-ARC domain-containing protein [Modestobacter altitudinis]
MEVARAVEVIHDRGENAQPRYECGSGFIIRPGVVLTAAHTIDAPDNPGSRTVVRDIEGFEYDVSKIAVWDERLDLALLIAENLAPDLSPAPLGRLDRNRIEVVTDAMAVGYPDFKQDKDRSLPQGTPAQPVGFIPTAENRPEGTLVVKLLAGEPDRAPGTDGPWKGLSGAGLIASSRLIGVVIEHRPAEGLGSLIVQPLTAVGNAPAELRDVFLHQIGITALSDLLEVNPQNRSRSRLAPPPPPWQRITARQREVDAVVARFDTHKRILTLTGLPGMGKTTIAQMVAHDPRVIGQFPGGIFWRSVGPDAVPERVADDLVDALGGAPVTSTLIVLDDVWDTAVLAAVVNTLSDRTSVLITTRGLSTGDTLRIGAVDPPAAQDLLLAAYKERHGPLHLTIDIDSVTSALGHWPVLLDLAGRLLADTATDPRTATQRLTELREEFAADPTVLDDPSGDGSLNALLMHSLSHLARTGSRLEPECFTALAVYQSVTYIPTTALAILWQLSPIKARQVARALDRVGLVTLSPATADRTDGIAVHDVVLAWLHQRHGEPDDVLLRPLHKRFLAGIGEPDGLTEDTSGLALYHVALSYDLDQVERLLTPKWRAAFAQVGSDSTYLAWLHPASRKLLHASWATSSESIRALSLASRAAVVAASIEDALRQVAPEALGAMAVLDRPVRALDLALQRHADTLDGLDAVLRFLHSAGQLTPSLLDHAFQGISNVADPELRAILLARLGHAANSAGQQPLMHRSLKDGLEVTESITSPIERSNALKHLSTLAARCDREEFLRLIDDIAEPDDQAEALAVAGGFFAAANDARADTLLDRAVQIMEARPKAALGAWFEDQSLVEVAVLLAPHSEERARRVMQRIESVAWRHRAEERVTAAITQLDDGREPGDESAVQSLPYEILTEQILLARQMPDVKRRSARLADLAILLSWTQPLEARRLAVEAVQAPIGGPVRLSSINADRILQAVAIVDAVEARRQATELATEYTRETALGAIETQLQVLTGTRNALAEPSYPVGDISRFHESLRNVGRLQSIDPARALMILQESAKSATAQHEPLARVLTSLRVAAYAGDLDPRLQERMVIQAADAWAGLDEAVRSAAHTAPVDSIFPPWPGAPAASGAAGVASHLERMVQTMPNHGERTAAFARLARGIAQEDPKYARRLAESAYTTALGLADTVLRSQALGLSRLGWLELDDQRARQVLDEAIVVARATRGGANHAVDLALDLLFETIRKFDEEGAQIVLRKMSYGTVSWGALERFIYQVADHDPGRAIGLTKPITDDRRAPLLANIAGIAAANGMSLDSVLPDLLDALPGGDPENVLCILAELAVGLGRAHPEQARAVATEIARAIR